ncbi:MAG: hypothetical protein JOZ33_04395 [Acidobacteriaceae bacterium]|nr:hypothetical protein [Acidobacteriaceae bacterium]
MKLARVICVSLIVLSSFGQSAQNYQVAAIVGVKPHQAKTDEASDVTRYEVSLKVAGTTYVVLYTPPLGVSTVKYATGHNLLVLVGDKTISYNDLLGQSFEVPIISRSPASDTAVSK